ncbi:MAG: cellobiose phosphorylase [Lachnospiraceae bacterium]|nr:cellobiose phosphorylase [Lachnospiraceae bacterium]
MYFLLRGNKGTFELKNADRQNYLYLPLTNASGIMDCITPDGHGDSKLGQNEFLMEPVSCEDLHESMRNRNIWCKVDGQLPWSVWGTSAGQQGKRFTGDEEDMTLEIGRLWQKATRVQKETGLQVSVLNFCPPTNERVEIMQVTMKNTGTKRLTVQPVAAIPIYGRSADNLRDHRHVTSLLNRIRTTKDGVEVIPALSFDERGHQENHRVYGVYGSGSNGEKPEGFYPILQDFNGAGGTLYWPKAVLTNQVPMVNTGEELEGYEAMGGICFVRRELEVGETQTFLVLTSYDREGMQYLQKEKVGEAFAHMEEWWDEKNPIHCKTSGPEFDTWMEWVGIQPFLRRIYGCSFLPHHDYGRGGRGWRDLWQDCLALILTNPADIRENLVNFYSGVRIDGSNATIIGSKPGEFKADRNAIVRIWMDHGYWPVLTTGFYLNQTGDYSLLLEKAPYFCDGITARGEQRTEKRRRVDNWLDNGAGAPYEGTLLEHLLVQNITQFFDTGEHNNMKLRGADWNDALDMAKERGESVAFTAAYSGNYEMIADMLSALEASGKKTVELSKELVTLMHSDMRDYDNTQKKRNLLTAYYDACREPAQEKAQISIRECIQILKCMSDWIHRHIRAAEVVEGDGGELWFNGYYDNDGQQVEWNKNGDDVRMMLTSQVFSIMSGTAADDQIEWIAKSVDRYLFDEKVGGYRLNTNFHEVKLNMGRAFGFAYGHKENGAVFCHMAVMYAYALYSRGFAREGYKVLKSLENQSMDFGRSGIYPGIPEYFNDRGQGLYHYLTGAGSWLVLTVTTQMFGVRGDKGDMILAPQLMKDQFDAAGNAEIRVCFAERSCRIIYQNSHHKELGDYEVEEIYVNEEKLDTDGNRIDRENLMKLDEKMEHVIRVVL